MIELDKSSAARLLRMIESGLIGYKHTMPWCDARIEEMPEPPYWVLELSTRRYRGDLIRIVGEYVYSEPFESFDRDFLGRYAIACLFLRYARRELSWATFLRESGDLSDAAGGVFPCEWFFGMLNDYEDSAFDQVCEVRQVAQVRGALGEAIQAASSDYEPFRDVYRPGDDG